jgi:hypothetical protein
MQELIERIARENGASIRLTSEHFDALKPMFRRPQRGKREAA